MVRLLIAEDDSALRRLLEQSLELLASNKFEIETCDNGDQAVRRLLSNGIDALVTDLKMPVMDGTEAIRRIREFSDIPIFVVSAFSDDRTIKAALAAGATRFFVKPPDFYRLASAILKLTSAAARKQSRVLFEHYRRLDALETKAAKYGLDAPVSILTEIEDIRAKIKALEND